MNIRPMTEEDVEAVFLLESVCFPDPWSRKSIRSTLREDRSCMLVAEENGVICGYLNSTYLFEELNLNRIAVSPDFRRRHDGASLLEALVDFCTARGLTRLMLEVREGNLPARRLYESFGFISLGERKNFYQNPVENALLLTRYLDE